MAATFVSPADRLKGRTAAEHAAAKEGALQDLETLREELARLEAGRHRVLVEGADPDLDRHDARTREVIRSIHRLEAVVTELEGRHREAVGAEAHEALVRRIAAARKAQERGVKAFARYGELASQLAATLGEIQSIDEEITATIRLADEAGAFDDVAGLRTASDVARPGEVPLYWHGGLGSARSEVVLPGLKVAHIRIWPPAQ